MLRVTLYVRVAGKAPVTEVPGDIGALEFSSLLDGFEDWARDGLCARLGWASETRGAWGRGSGLLTGGRAVLRDGSAGCLPLVCYARRFFFRCGFWLRFFVRFGVCAAAIGHGATDI